MSILRPGGPELTRYALERAGIKKGARILDVGCGDGTVAAFMKQEFGSEVVAIDTDAEAVEKAKEKGVDARKMDAAMLDFDIYEFDAVLMECVFTALARQEESIHEAYCVLKPGGSIILSDLYCREPDMERWQKDHREAMALFYRPREHENCGHEETLPSPYCQDGAVVMKGLRDLLKELELEIVLEEDRTKELEEFAAQAIMDSGSLEAWFKEHGSWNWCDVKRKDVGYFLLIAHKPERHA